MKTLYSLSVTLFFTICFNLSPVVSQAQFSSLTNETRVNTTTAGNQFGYWWSPRTIAVQPDGGYIIAWMDLGGADGQAEGIFAQRYNASGAKVGSEFQVNTTFSGQQYSPAVAVAPDGSFLIAWEGPGVSIDIFAQRFTKNGVKIGSEFLLNTTVTGNQRYPEIQYYPDGTFVAGFVDAAQTVLQRFDEEARAFGPETRISSVSGDVIMDGLCVRPDNSILMVWTTSGDVYGQIFDANLQPQASQTKINTYTTGTQEYAVGRVDGSGNFIITWESDGQDGSGMGIYGRRFDNNFNALSGEFAITTNTTNNQFEPQVAIEPGGRFIIAWSDNNNRDGGGGSPDLAGPGCSLWMREYNANGNPVGSETMINQSVTGYQGYPVIDMNASGRFVISWEGNGTIAGNTDNFGIYTRAFQLSQSGTTTISVSPTTTTASDIVTITMTLTNPVSISNVIPNPLSVSGTNGVFATLISGPSPASATVGTSPVTFTWTYRITAKDASGQLTFGGNACNKSGYIFPYAVSNTITVKAALYVSDITATSLIDDSNDPTSGPRVFTIGAKITNLSTNTISNIQINVGNGTTAGTFPVTVRTLLQTNNTYQGSFSLIALAGAGDCVRGIASLGGAKNVINGSIDFNGDGAVTTADDGILSNGKTVIDGRVDVNKNGVINTTDDLPRPPGVYDGYRDPSIIDGYVDINGDGVINASDASTYGGETKNIYWFVRYDVVDAANQPTFGNCNDFADDLQYKWIVWASGNDGGVTRTAKYSDYAKVRCELSAASNKVMPSGAYISSFPNSIIDGQIDVNSDGIISGADDGSFYYAGVIDGKWDIDKSGVINTADDATIGTYNVIDGYIDLTKDGIINNNDDGVLVGVGQTFSITFNNASFGTIGNGFDANRDNLWDYDFWIQPIGGTSFAAASFRLVDIQSNIVGTGGNNPLNGITTHFDNEPYLSRLFDDRLGQSGGFNGSYTYTFEVLSMGNTFLNPYQEAASGTNNEKYSNDFPSVGTNIFTMPVALAVNGLEATAKLSNANTATIDWKTETESNSDYFIVERSTDGRNFTTVSSHIKAAGNSSVTKHYQFNDDISSIVQYNKIYYRVIETDINSKITVSNIVLVNLKTSATISTWPNPFQSVINVNINSTTKTEVILKISNVAGVTIRSFKQQIEKGITQVALKDFDRLPAGMYLLEVIDQATGKRTTEKLIKNR